MVIPSLRGQTVHWIGSQFLVCRSLYHSKCSLTYKNFVSKSKEIQDQKKIKESNLIADSVYNLQNTQFWPRKGPSKKVRNKLLCLV